MSTPVEKGVSELLTRNKYISLTYDKLVLMGYASMLLRSGSKVCKCVAPNFETCLFHNSSHAILVVSEIIFSP